MAFEPFLINPAKRKRRKSGGGKRRRKLSGAALAMHQAKVAGRAMPYRRKRRKSGGSKKRHKVYSKKRYSYAKKHRRTGVVRAYSRPRTVIIQNRPARRRRYRQNPYLGIVNRPRRYRRNPARSGVLSMPAGLSISKAVGWFAVAGGAAIVSRMAPTFLPASMQANVWARYGAQIGAGVLGYWAIKKYARRSDWAVVFLAVSGGALFADLLSTYVLGYFVPMPAATTGTTAGITPAGYGIGAFTRPVSRGQMGAYPGPLRINSPYAHRATS